MVDATTLTVAATVAQTIVITATLLVFIFQFRSQEKAIHESSYQNLMGRYNDAIMLQASREKPSKYLMDRIQRISGKEVTPDDAQTFAQFLVIYGIIEEAFTLYKKKWIDKESWEQWSTWAGIMMEDPRFMLIHDSSSGTFDKDFEDYLTKLEREKRKQDPSDKRMT